MEFRKLISFGKNSFVVSLPKTWIQQNKLKKGDLVYINESENNLNLSAKQHDNEKEKEVTLFIDGVDSRRIQRDIIGAYINNYKVIRLIGNEISKKAEEIQGFIQKMVALEIVEQDSKKIVAKDFLNLKDISVIQIVKKMDSISRSMLSDCKRMFIDDTYTSIYHRDHDINKFRYLAYRMVWYGLENPSTVYKNFHLTQIDLFNLWWLSLSIEQIGDCIKRVARSMKDTKLSDKSKKVFVKLLEDVETNYLQILRAYYRSNMDVAHEVTGKRGELIKRCDDFLDKNKDIADIGYLVYNIKGLIVNISSIARTIYQGKFLQGESHEKQLNFGI